MINPELIHDSETDDLASEYEHICFQENQLKMYKQQIREELESRVKTDAEIFGNVSISRVRKPDYGKADIDQAKGLGAVYAVVREVEQVEDLGLEHTLEIDTKVLQKLYKSGAKIDLPITEYFMCKVLTEDEEA